MEKTILAVDDDEMVLKSLAKVLLAGGYSVRTAQGAEEALKIIEEEDIKVYFLDLKMPYMDGIEVCERIKASKPMSVVYALTGHMNEFHVVRCREAGFDDYFIKPFGVEETLTAAEAAFDKIARWDQAAQDSS